MKRKHYFFVLLVMLFVAAGPLCGCGILNLNKDNSENGGAKTEAIDYVVCDEMMIPDELKEIINNKKSEAFSLSYEVNSYTYLAIGYGEMDRCDLSIIIEELKLKNENLYIETLLRRKYEADNLENVSKGDTKTMPYIVIRCEIKDVPVIFNPK